MKKEIYIVYCNDGEIAFFEKKSFAKKYVEYLNFYNCNDDKYYYRKGFFYV